METDALARLDLFNFTPDHNANGTSSLLSPDHYYHLAHRRRLPRRGWRGSSSLFSLPFLPFQSRDSPSDLTQPNLHPSLRFSPDSFSMLEDRPKTLGRPD